MVLIINIYLQSGLWLGSLCIIQSLLYLADVLISSYNGMKNVFNSI